MRLGEAIGVGAPWVQGGLHRDVVPEVPPA